MSVKKNTLYNFVLVLANILFPFISAPYVSHILHIEDIGLVNNGAAFSALFIKLCSFGIVAYSQREIARVKENEKDINRVFSEGFTAHFLITLVGCVIYFLYVYLFVADINTKKMYFIFLFLVFVEPLKLEWFYTGIENFKFIANRSIFVKVLSLIGLFIFVKTENDFYIYGILTVAATSLNCFFNLIHCRKFVKYTFTLKNFFHILFSSKYFYLLNIVTICYQNLNQLLLGKNNTDLALYVRATGLAALLSLLINPIINAVAPRTSNLFNKEREQYNYYVLKAYSYVGFLLFPATFGMAVLGKNIMYLFGGTQFAEGGLVLTILAFAYLLSNHEVFINEIISIPSGNEKNTVVGNVVVAVFSLILNPLLIFRYGAIGAALVSLITELIGLIVQIFLIKKQKIINNFKIRKLLIYLISSVIMVCILQLLKPIFLNIYIQTIFLIFIGVTLYFTLYIVISKIFKVDIEELKFIADYLHKKVIKK